MKTVREQLKEAGPEITTEPNRVSYEGSTHTFNVDVYRVDHDEFLKEFKKTDKYNIVKIAHERSNFDDQVNLRVDIFSSSSKETGVEWARKVLKDIIKETLENVEKGSKV